MRDVRLGGLHLPSRAGGLALSGKRIAVRAPPGSALSESLASAGFEPAPTLEGAVGAVFSLEVSGAGEEMERCIERGLPCVAFLPVGWSPEHGPEIFAPAALEFAGLVADAYASDLRGLPEALRFVLEEDRARRGQGPLRLTWLGPLGHVYPAPIGPVGTSFPLGPTGLLLGRARDNGVCLGAGHSDQTSVARRHAKVEPTAEGARVRDLGSSNGTWCRGERAPEHVLRPGEELALSGALRFRLDGK